MSNNIKYWVACSGGIDSVVLTHLLFAQGLQFGIVHCNFHLRGLESNLDEEFVRQLAKELDVPVLVQDFDTNKYALEHRLNTQLAARELRYNWFDKVIQEKECFILLGQHYDDQVETFFLQLRRGGGVKGLAAMPVYRNGYVRPLLKYTKKEIIDLAEKHKWKWREDKTNLLNDYKRNWYRNEVLPWLQTQGFPLDKVVPLIQEFQELYRFLDALPIPSIIAKKEWKNYPIWYKQWILSAQQLGEFSEKEISRLAETQKGKFIGNQQVKVWNEGEKLFFVKEEPAKEFQLEIIVRPIGEIRINAEDLFLDTSKIENDLSFRSWTQGDRIRPLGMNGEKAMGKFLRDRKVYAHLKDKIQVLVNTHNKVLGVFGHGVDDRYKITPQTEKVTWVRLKEI